MSDTLPEDAWVNAFLSAPPRPLQQALQKRLQASQTHIHAVAELFKQRALIESQYAESLSKLARTATQGGLNGKNSIEWDKSGGEAKLWDNMLTEIQEVSRCLRCGRSSSAACCPRIKVKLKPVTGV